MAKKKKDARIHPMNLKNIRLFFNLTQEEMARKMTMYAKKCIEPIPGSRINEWEGDHRSVPQYICEAYFHMVVHEWGLRREKTSDPAVVDMDIASLIDPALGYAACLYYRVRHADEYIHRLDVALEVADLFGMQFASMSRRFGSKVAPIALPPVEV